MAWEFRDPDTSLYIEVIATLAPGRQDSAGEGEWRKLGVANTLNLNDEAIAKRRGGGWDESFAIATIIYYRQPVFITRHGHFSIIAGCF